MATRSLGQLTLDLVARIGGFTGPLEKAKRSAKSDMADIAKSAKVASTAVLAIAGSAAATGGAVVAFTKHAADNARELKNQASVANASTTEIQRWSYASQQVGVEQDKLGDILKDVNDRVGDFMATGGGPMADFFNNIAPQVGVTAEQFRNLSGPQALQLYYDSLEKANLNQQDMTFYLEAMASDTTALIPLLRDGGRGISDMGDEAERLGLVLSDIDIAQLEEFARQFDRISSQISTVGNMLAADLAPYLSVVADRIEDVGTNAEELGLIFPSALRDTIEAIGYLLDAIHILNIPLQGMQAFAATIAQAYTTAFATITNAATSALDFIAGGLNDIIEGFNHLPGVDVPLIGSFNDSPYMKGVRAMAAEVAEQAEKQRQDFLDAWNAPMPSDAIDDYLADVDAKLAAFRAEQDGIPLKTLDQWLFKPPSGGGGGGGTGTSTETDAIGDQVASLQQQAKMLGMTADQQTLYKLAADGATQAQVAQARAALESVAAYDDQQQALDAYRSLVDELRTPEEKLNDTLLKRLDILEAAKVSQDEYADAVARIADGGFTDAPEYEGLDASIGGAFGELGKIDDAQAELEDWYATQLEMLDNYRSERADLTEQWDTQERELKQQHEDEIARIEQARQMAQLAAAESVFGDLAGLTSAFVGEQSGAYRALFAVSKAAAVAQALINAPSSYSKAYDAVVGIPYVGPALAPAAGAVAAAAQVAQAGMIQNVGMAHDGIDAVPADGSWYLQKGERVTTSETSAKLDRTLDNVQSRMAEPGESGSASGGGLHLTVDARGATDPAAVRRQVQRGVDEALARVGQDFATNGKLRRMLKV